MNSKKLNELPEKIKNGEITKKEAVNLTCTFISENFPIFGLHKYDEDFREDIIVYFLERGESLFEKFNPSTADFFTFIYSTVLSYINTKRRCNAQEYIKEAITVSESINMLSEKEEEYNCIDYKKFELAKVPYSYKPITAETLKQIFKPISDVSNDKKILVLAMKSSFYLPDSMIKKVCKLYKIKEDDFYKTIQFCKDSINNRNEKHKTALERRNYAYYHYKKYEHEITYKRENFPEKEIKNQLLKKHSKHSKNWKTLNMKFSNGFLYLRPTNKTIADILGICERQVSYYINCAKKEYEKNIKEINDIKND